jgi:hypothetical protein
VSVHRQSLRASSDSVQPNSTVHCSSSLAASSLNQLMLHMHQHCNTASYYIIIGMIHALRRHDAETHHEFQNVVLTTVVQPLVQPLKTVAYLQL